MAILSRFYGLEMAVVDTLNAIINRFGEDKNYGQRVFLLFDGVHYDPLYLEQSDVRTIYMVNYHHYVNCCDLCLVVNKLYY